MTDILVRPLDATELDAARALLVPEGWDFSVPELERLARLGGTIGAFDGARLVGFLSYVDHPPVRWVGNVVVSHEARGQGVGESMARATLGGLGTTALYSVEKAVTLYARVGFVARGDAHAYRAENAEPLGKGRSEELRASDLRDVVHMDLAASGMDRRALIQELLRAYPKHVRVVREGDRVTGYGIAKTSPGLTELGPIVATTNEARDDLLDDLLADTTGPHEATVLAESRAAIAALERRGFAKRFRVVPMFHGAPPAWRPDQLVVAAGLEKG